MQITVNQRLEKKVEGVAAVLDLQVDDAANMLIEKGLDILSGSLGRKFDQSPSIRAQAVDSIAQHDKTKLADRIRAHAIKNVIDPARKMGKEEVRIKAGDIHRDLRLQNRLPAVCAALGSNIFLKLASVSLTDESGPANGATKEFTYRI